MSSQFLFATCHPGAEPALLRELSRLRPAWRPAFRRPGFLTFKLPSPESLWKQPWLAASVFAQRYGASLGRAQGESDAERLAAVIRRAAELRWPAVPRLSAWVRPMADDDAALGAAWQAGAERTEMLLEAARAAGFAHSAGAPASGDWVLDLCIVDPAAWMLGLHRQSSDLVLAPPTRADLPPATPQPPSRAYHKLREVVAFFGLDIGAGQSCVEIGVAPGGAALALLELGASVTGIDAAEVDPRLAAFGERFRQVRESAAAVGDAELPASVDWWLVDINAGPDVALGLLEPLARRRPARRGIVVTVKLSDWRHIDRVARAKERLQAWGYATGAKHLPSHHREAAVVALPRPGSPSSR